MSKMNSTINSRYVYENASRMMTEAGVDPSTAVLTQSDLRLEQQLATNKTEWQFAVLDNNNGASGTFFNTEIRLTQQDAFVASAWGLFLSKPASAVDATYILHTYPSALTFSTAGVAAAYETLYNSKLSIMVNNKNIVPVVSTRRFRMVPQSQAVAPGANENGIAQDQIDLSSDGWAIAEPNLPAALAATEAFGRMHLLFEGVLAQNVTIIT